MNFKRMISRKRIFFAAFLFVIVFLAASRADLALKSSQDIPKPGGTLHVRDFSDAFKPNFDPASGVCAFVTEQIFDGLVKLGDDLIPAPALAEYWTPSEDGKKHVFYLRRGVRFHDGKEVTSQDVKFSLERLIAKETQSPYREYFTTKVVGAQEFWEGKAADVSGFRTPDKYVFEIEWRNPFAAALYLLGMSYCKVLPRDLVISQGKNFFLNPVGTGAFKFDSWVRSPKLDILGVRLERNDAYFDKKAYLEAVEFSPSYTEDHFVDKEIEVMPFLSERLARAGCQVKDGGPQNISFLMMSCQIPPLDRPSIRKALAYAIDREKLALAVQAGEFIRRTTNNYIPPQWPGFFPLDDAYNYNPEKAWQVLNEQGFFTDKKFPELVLFLPAPGPVPRSDAHLKFAAELESQLDKLGIALTVKYYRTLRDVKDARRPFLMKVDWSMDFPDPESIILPLFQSRSEINLGNHKYVSPQLDALLEEAERERSWDRRTALFRRMERILVDEMPAIPLFTNVQRIALQPYVRGAKMPAWGISYLNAKEIWLDNKEPQQ